jgi:hypothetical protein
MHNKKKLMEKKKAQRFNRGKLELTQSSQELVAAAAVVFMKNSKKYNGKYDDMNWKVGTTYTELINCLRRHLAQFETGVDIDKESGLPHIFLVAANIQMLLHNYLHFPENDDRDKRFPIDFSEFTKYLKSEEEVPKYVGSAESLVPQEIMDNTISFQDAIDMGFFNTSADMSNPYMNGGEPVNEYCSGNCMECDFEDEDDNSGCA